MCIYIIYKLMWVCPPAAVEQVCVLGLLFALVTLPANGIFAVYNFIDNNYLSQRVR